MKYTHHLLSLFSLNILIPLTSQGVIEISGNQKMDLIRKYAPEVRFHKDEKYFPMAMSNFLPYVDLRDQNGKVILNKGEVNATTMANFKDEKYKDYYLGFADNSMKEGVKKDKDNRIHAPVYVNFVPTDDGAVIQYIFFYPFNGPFQMGKLGPISGLVNRVTKIGDIGEHEGDIEHINVRLDSNLNLKDVYYARHRPGLDGGYDNPELVGTHPVVYQSKYGHASHPHHKDRQSDQDATSSNGPVWRTWENPIDLGTKEVPTAGNAWNMFAGHLGGTDRGKESPRGPAHQNWWRSSAYQVFNNLAKVKVENGKSPDFELNGYMPTYIRKLEWNIAKINTPGITPESITYDVMDTNNRVIFPGLKGPRTATRFEKKKFRIGNVKVNGQPNNVSFELEANSLMD